MDTDNGVVRPEGRGGTDAEWGGGGQKGINENFCNSANNKNKGGKIRWQLEFLNLAAKA